MAQPNLSRGSYVPQRGVRAPAQYPLQPGQPPGSFIIDGGANPFNAAGASPQQIPGQSMRGFGGIRPLPSTWPGRPPGMSDAPVGNYGSGGLPGGGFGVNPGDPGTDQLYRGPPIFRGPWNQQGSDQTSPPQSAPGAINGQPQTLGGAYQGMQPPSLGLRQRAGPGPISTYPWQNPVL